MEVQISRRRFVKLGLAAAAALGLTGWAYLLGLDKAEPEAVRKPAELPAERPKTALRKDPLEDPGKKQEQMIVEGMPYRQLGKTGCPVSLLGLGGSFTLAREDMPDQAEAIVNRAVDLGINYIDTAPSYGASESNIGRVVKHRRSEVFLATKTRDRSYDGTMTLFEQSLRRLQTDRIDLLQLHGIHSREDLKQSFGPDGALKALEKLKQEGSARYIGITGHREPAVLFKAIMEYDFDCILLSLNPADLYYQPLQTGVLPAARAMNMGIVAMKIAAYGRIFRDSGIDCMEKALGYALSFPVSTAIVGISTLEELDENVRIVRSFEALSSEELRRLEQLVEPYHQEVNFFKTEW